MSIYCNCLRVLLRYYTYTFTVCNLMYVYVMYTRTVQNIHCTVTHKIYCTNNTIISINYSYIVYSRMNTVRVRGFTYAGSNPAQAMEKYFSIIIYRNIFQAIYTRIYSIIICTYIRIYTVYIIHIQI